MRIKKETDPVLAAHEQTLLGRLKDCLQQAMTETGTDRRTLSQLTGISYSYMSDIVNGRTMPSVGMLWKIAEALGMRPGDLLDMGHTPAKRFRVLVVSDVVPESDWKMIKSNYDYMLKRALESAPSRSDIDIVETHAAMDAARAKAKAARVIPPAKAPAKVEEHTGQPLGR